MKIDPIDLNIIREVENGCRIFLDLIEKRLNLSQEEIKLRLQKLESERLIQAYKVIILIPPFLGGEWSLGSCLAIATQSEGAINQIIEKLPFVTEVSQNSALPDGIGPNLGILFYTKDFPTNVQFLKELKELDYCEIYNLSEYSFPIPTPLSTKEIEFLRILFNHPIATIEEWSEMIKQDSLWIKEKLGRLVASPANESAVIQVLPELDWRVCENYCHVHFIVEKGTEPNWAKLSDFQPVLSSRPFRERFGQLETDLWGFDQLNARIKILKQSNVVLKGIVLAETHRVINHWATKLLE